MVLAQREDVNVAHDDHLVMVFSEDSRANDIGQALLIALGHPQQRLGVSLWRAGKPLAIRVLADALE